MAVQATPYVETALSHSAELFRRTLQASSLPLGSAGGIVPVTPNATGSANLTAGVTGFSDLAVSAPASGMSVNVNPGQIIIPGSLGSGSGYGMGKGYGYPVITTNGASAPTISSTANATQIQLTTQGAYYCYNDDSAGVVNLTISASNPTNPRIDLVVAQVQDAAYSGSSNNWQLAVVTGTAAASPTIPTLPASCVPLALVWVPANAANIVAADILDVRVNYNRNPYSGRMYSNATTTLNSGNLIVPFASINNDFAAMCTTGASAKITVPVSGEWAIDAAIYFTAPATGASYIIASIMHNGVADYERFSQTSIVASSAYAFATAITPVLNVGDTIQVNVDNTGSGAGTIGAAGFPGLVQLGLTLRSPI